MSTSKYKLIALFGESGSGKTTILNWMVEHYPNTLHQVIACTTRPMREGESNGDPYNFLTIEDFTKKILNGEMIEATTFRDWFYGTELHALSASSINIAIFSPEALNCILEDSRIQVVPVYISTDGKIRLLRSLTREESPDCYEICRRYLADLKDFADIDYDYLVWPNNIDDDYLRGQCAQRIFNQFRMGESN